MPRAGGAPPSAVRIQAAVVRALADETRRAADGPNRDAGLRTQLREAEARLLGMVAGLLAESAALGST
jgi:hypothetical protein